MAQLSLMPDIPEPPSYAESISTGAFLPAPPSSAPPSATTSLPQMQSDNFAACAARVSLVELEASQSMHDPLPAARLMFYAHLVLRALGFDVRTGVGLPHALVRLIDYRNHHLLSLRELHSLVHLVTLLAPMRLEGIVLACDESLPEGEAFRFSRVYTVSLVCFSNSYYVLHCYRILSLSLSHHRTCTVATL